MAKGKTILRAPNLLKPHILAELRRRGGHADVGERGRPGADRDLYAIVAARVGVTAHERDLTLVDLDPGFCSRVAAGQRATANDAERNAWDYTMLVAVQQLKAAGLVAKATPRGRWELTALGSQTPSPADAPSDSRPISDLWIEFQAENDLGVDLFSDDEAESPMPTPEPEPELTAQELAFLEAMRDDGPAEQPRGNAEMGDRFCRELLAFYGEDDGPAGNGYTREQLLGWSDSDWEREHDFIQWLFPTDHASQFNPDAPVLDGTTATVFRADPLLRHRLRQSFDRWLAFCGVGRSPPGLAFVRPRPHVWDRQNHNWLRVTRVLRSLAVLGLTDEAVEFFLLLESIRSKVDAETWSHWQAAVEPIWMAVILAKN